MLFVNLTFELSHQFVHFNTFDVWAHLTDQFRCFIHIEPHSDAESQFLETLRNFNFRFNWLNNHWRKIRRTNRRASTSSCNWDGHKLYQNQRSSNIPFAIDELSSTFDHQRLLTILQRRLNCGEFETTSTRHTTFITNRILWIHYNKINNECSIRKP